MTRYNSLLISLMGPLKWKKLRLRELTRELIRRDRLAAKRLWEKPPA